MADWKERLGVVYSTNPNFKYEMPETPVAPHIEPGKQKLRVWLDRKMRAGKQVTVVGGYVGPASEMEDLCKMLKKGCGVGGAVKDGEILIQGDKRELVLGLLQKSGYQAKGL
ncbi:MAG: translation initiation factor [Alistipes sp.]|nr:translation initiation factor [Candidatus Alistipes equi]